MKSKFVILSVLFLYVGLTNINGQDSLLIDRSKIDSLKRLIELNPKTDKEEIRLLNEYARLCFYNQEYKEGLIAAREARELSKKIEFDGGIVMYHITLGIFSQGRGVINPYHRMKAGMLAKKTDDKALLRNPIMPNDYPYPLNEKTLKKLQPALEYFTALGDKEILTVILFINGLYYMQNRQPDKVNQLMDQIITLYKDMTLIEPVIIANTGKILAAQSINNQSGADSIFHELTRLLDQVKTENITGITNFQLSFISSSLQQFAATGIGYLTKSADFFKQTGDLYSLSMVYQQMVTLYMFLEMHSSRADIFERIIPILNESGDIAGNADFLYQNAVWANYNSKRYDKAREYLNYAFELEKRDSLDLYRQFSPRFLNAQKDHLEGQIQMDQGNYAEAISLLTKAYNTYNNSTVADRNTRPWAAIHIANCYYQEKEYQSALQYANLCYNTAGTQDLRFDLKSNLQLADIYEVLGKKDSAYKYLRKYQDLLKASKKLENTRQIFELQINSIVRDSEKQINQLEQESLLKEQKNKNQRLFIFSTIGALLSTLLILLILYKNNKSKQKANTVLERTLSNLKSTQSQLVQSEKMASLGELTAGIAHEIQNPLNFVNNFSEVNSELIAEMKQEIDKGNLQEVKSIANSIDENEQKIIVHGKRADAIVKNMLQHSRSSSGIKEPTDINALCNEYLRLSYHGLRAKDKSFNATMKTDFDESIGRVNIIPQDMGRVVLNLINNAFYAVDEKKKHNQNGYEPQVSVSTKKNNDKVEIKVSDNGNGMPQKVMDKIFQPFFTTKPTGLGTGLGLSLSYDIVKAHGGELKVETKEGKGTVFIIHLPT